MNLEQIDTSTTAGKAEVMRLAAEGRGIAERTIPVGKWSATSFPLWNWHSCDYAIIAEPVGPEEVWVVVPVGAVIAGPLAHLEDGAIGPKFEKVRYLRADLAGEKCHD